MVAWPAGNDPGHVGLWFRSPNQKFDPNKKVDFHNKPDFMAGWPFKDSTSSLLPQAGWPTRPIDTSTFISARRAKAFRRSTSAAIRRRRRASSTRCIPKSIFVDIDVDANDPKKYATQAEAWQEFTTLRKKLNLPPPSAVVDSGGGLQVYWISKTPLLPHEWTPYAQGLKDLLLANNFKFDPTCTADIARVMRMPGTYNAKYSPAPIAQLLTATVKLYDFAALDFLKQHAGAAPARTAQAHPLFAEGADMQSFKGDADARRRSQRPARSGHRQVRRHEDRPAADLPAVRLLQGGPAQRRQEQRPASMEPRGSGYNLHGGRQCHRTPDQRSACDVFRG